MQKRKLRVVMLIQAYHPRIGGAERQLAAQASLLQERGIDVQVVTRRYAGLKAYELVNGIPVHRMPIPGPRSTAAISYIAAALWSIGRLRPQVIHAHELLSPATTAILARWLYRVPVLAKVLRGGPLGDLTKISAGRLGPARVRLVCRQIDQFAVISREIDDELAAMNVPAEKRRFIPNGVDTRRFSPVTRPEKEALRARLGLPNGQLAVFAGRLEPEKRLSQLISLWPTVRGRVPDANLIILGTGSLEEDLRAHAGEGVELPGPVQDVPSYLRAADLFVLPSAGEGLSNSLLEAMASGLPCIATRVGGTVDLIEHAQNGWLIEPDSRDQLCDGLLHVLGDDDLRAGLGEQARRRIERDYSLDSVVDRLETLYREMASRP